MELPLNNSAHAANVATEEERSAWKVPIGIRLYRGSSDASLFSSSLPVLPHEKLGFSESGKSAQPLDDVFPSLDRLKLADEVKDPFKDIEPSSGEPYNDIESSTIGTFLPGDEDELLAGLMDDFDLSGLPTQIEDLDDDFFGSGFEIEAENYENTASSSGISRLLASDGLNVGTLSQNGFPNGVGTVSGEHPYGEHPSRTLFVRNINSNVEDSELKSLFEQYGDIRTLYTACKHRGFVMISYYDIRAARTAMRALQNKPLRRRKLDIHFSIPKDNPSEKDINQGTLVVFNLDPSVSNDDLIKIFGTYGEVKEIRETPHKRHHKFIEFYDVRAAEAALKALNRSDIAGKRIKLEPSRPGGSRRSLIQQLTLEQEQDETRVLCHSVGSPITNSPPGTWPNYGSPVDQNSLHAYNHSPKFRGFSPVGSNNTAGLASVLSLQSSSPLKNAPIGISMRRSQVNPVVSPHGSAYQQHFPVGDTKISSRPPTVSSFSDSKSSSVGTLSGHQFLWGSPTINSEQIASSPWSSSLRGQPFLSGQQGVRFPTSNHHSSILSSHHVGSAPSGIPLERRFGFFPESPESSFMNQNSFGMTNLGHGIGKPMNINAHGNVNMGVAFAGNFSENGPFTPRMMSLSRNMPVYYGNGSILSSMNDGLTDRNQGRRPDAGIQMDNKKQYQLDLERIANGEDNRTTLMIKNIPNKYTSKMLLAAIDETHNGAYDFLYLPIDFKNKCNVGYAFINMINPSHIITFHEAFNGKKWEKFNSEKVASLAYARIQGKTALVSNFQNSSLMNEDKRCRPILFQSEGQATSDMDAFPYANVNIFIRQPDGSYTGDSLDSPKSEST